MRMNHVFVESTLFSTASICKLRCDARKGLCAVALLFTFLFFAPSVFADINIVGFTSGGVTINEGDDQFYSITYQSTEPGTTDFDVDIILDGLNDSTTWIAVGGGCFTITTSIRCTIASGATETITFTKTSPALGSHTVDFNTTCVVTCVGPTASLTGEVFNVVNIPGTITANPSVAASELDASVNVTLSRIGGSTGTVSVDVATVDGTATVGEDYGSFARTVTWIAGDTLDKIMVLPLLDDTVFEGDESYTLALTNPAGGVVIGQPNITILITDNEIANIGTPAFVSAVNVDESAGNAVLTVSRVGGSDGPLTIDYLTSNAPGDTALEAVDYQAVSGVLTWANGDATDRTFNIPIIDDGNAEGGEFFTVVLLDSDFAELDSVAVTITDNDGLPPTAEAGADITLIDYDRTGAVEVILDSPLPDDGSLVFEWFEGATLLATGKRVVVPFDVGVHNVTLHMTDAGSNLATDDLVVTIIDPAIGSTRLIGDALALTGNPASVAAALDNICPRLAEVDQQHNLTIGETNLLSRCNELLNPGNTVAQLRGAVNAIAAEEVSALQTSAGDLARNHQSNLNSRFVALRQGSNGVDLSGLKVVLTGGVLDSRAFTNSSLGGGASADDVESDGNEWSLFNTNKLGFFINGSVRYVEIDETTNEAGYDFDVLGLTAGVDYRFYDNFAAGFALGYASTDLQFISQGGEMESENLFYSVYTYYAAGNSFYIDSNITFGDVDFTTTRNINYTTAGGAVSQAISGTTTGSQVAGGINLGFDFNRGPWTFGPDLSFFLVDADIDGFSESGASGLEMNFGEQENKSQTVHAGFHGNYVISTGWGVVIPSLRANYVSELQDDSRIIDVGFVHDRFSRAAGAPPSIAVTTDKPDSEYYVIGFGLNAQFVHGFSGFFDYETYSSLKNTTVHRYSFGLHYEKAF